MKVGTDEPVIEIITWLFIGSGIFVSAVGLVGLIGTIRGSKIMLGFVSNTLKKLVILFDSAKKYKIQYISMDGMVSKNKHDVSGIDRWTIRWKDIADKLLLHVRA